VRLYAVGCEYVIALTHMRTPNDIRLAESVPEIDLILGGHDHVYEKRKVLARDCIKRFFVCKESRVDGGKQSRETDIFLKVY
jgi:2',3'-cyclic-nucleotide 2'-phosphodiesterase (5'-nucleotidase family)